MERGEPEDVRPEEAPDAGPSPPSYPPGPSGLPAPRASLTYRLRVLLVLASLFVFLAFYVGLVSAAAWAVWASIFEIGWIRGRGAVLNVGLVAVASMLLLFLAKGLFHRTRFDDDALHEVTDETQPRLFAFLRRLAADAGARLPGKVFLSHDVNAAVMFPRSLLTLVWPTKKHLVLGLGLVNALDVSELKAVLAHELGHFSQASMRLGRYVYVAQGVIADLVYGRDRWDDALRSWQRVDLRLSFPAWIIAGVVWVIRKALHLVFQGITLANLSLSRQMEFDADANAVRLAGSDAIVSGLWKSERAQLALGHALSGLASVAEHGKHTRDLFFHQGRSLRRLDAVVGKDPDTRAHFASILAPYRPGPALHFQPGGEQVSGLWRTHPPHHEREAKAKAPYVQAPTDGRSAWSLFVEPERVRRTLTRLAYRALGAPAGKALPPRQIEQLVEEERGEMRQADHYHGLYENRVVAPGKVDELAAKLDALAERGELDVEALRAKARAFTGERLAAKTRRLEALRGEQQVIAALRGGATLQKKRVPFRGDERSGAEILQLSGEVERDLEEALAELKKADVRFFRLFYARAREEPGAREELLLRYRFLLAVQGLLLDVARFEDPFEVLVRKLGERAEFSEGDVLAIRSLCEDARLALARALSAARGLERPALALLDDERSLDAFLLGEPIVEELPPGAIPGAWLAELLRQHATVLRRLRKLHFKNLGALLALGERLEPDLFPREAPAAEADEEPSG